MKFAKITDLAQSPRSRISEYRHFLPHNIRVASFQQQQKQLMYMNPPHLSALHLSSFTLTTLGGKYCYYSFSKTMKRKLRIENSFPQRAGKQQLGPRADRRNTRVGSLLPRPSDNNSQPPRRTLPASTGGREQQWTASNAGFLRIPFCSKVVQLDHGFLKSFK